MNKLEERFRINFVVERRVQPTDELFPKDSRGRGLALVIAILIIRGKYEETPI